MCKECLQDYTRTFQQRHSDYYREYAKTHKEALKALSQNRRARKKGIPGSHTAKDIQKQYKNQKGRCYYCMKKIKKGKNSYHVDHIIPISREGSSNGPENLVIACPTCNCSKHNKLPHEWPQGGRLL